MKHKHDIFCEFTPEITIYMCPSPAKSISETEDFIQNALNKKAQHKDLQLVITHKKTQEFLGCVGLHKIDKPIPELGIWIKKSAHGNGYGIEAVQALKQWADQNLEYEKISYPCAAENAASRRIPESLGGQVIAEWEMEFQGVKRPSIEYHIPRQKTY